MSGTARGGAISLAEITRALLTQRSPMSESVTLKQNAKGETQVEVTAVRADDERLTDAARRALVVYENLRLELQPGDTLLADLQASVKP